MTTENITNAVEGDLLHVEGLRKCFPLKKSLTGKVLSELIAVNDVSFDLKPGETIGIVGESGCGKTTLGRTILRLHECSGGSAMYYGKTVFDINPSYARRALAGAKSQLAKADRLERKAEALVAKAQICESEKQKAALLFDARHIAITVSDIRRTVYKLIGGFAACPDCTEGARLMYERYKLKVKLAATPDNEALLGQLKELEIVISKAKEVALSLPDFDSCEAYLDEGVDLAKLNSREMRKLRLDMQIIFQDPYSSLPPRSTVGGILSEPVNVHKIVPKAEVKDYVLNLMEKCGLRDYYYERYPHEFSGGQRQRICIARALSVNPKLVICDEPVSALDVSIQAQIINLLRDLQRSMNLTYIFISHDLSVVKFISDKIGVMYLGSMMEFGDKKDIFGNPLHPYTKALFSAIPNPNPDVKMDRIVLSGDIPSPANPPKGCRFHTRCPNATERCKCEVPVYREYEPGHFAACHLLEEDSENR